MKISERIKLTIEDWIIAWRERLKGWMIEWLSFGLEIFFNIIGKAAAPKLTPLIEKLEATGEIPPEVQPILDEIKNPTGQVGAVFAQSAGSAVVGGAIGRVLDTLLNPVSYAFAKDWPNALLAQAQYLALWLRGKISDEDLRTNISYTGISPAYTELLKELTQVRLDPASVITAWRRDPAKYEKLFTDLKDQGWDDDRIEALKFFTLYIPSAAEIVHWYAREVYEPEMIDRYGLDSELPNYEETDFPKIGVDSIQAKHHWMAHWEHASYMQIREMIHRGVLSKDKTMPAPPTTKEEWASRDTEGTEAAYDWYRLVEIPPFWRARLTEMMFNVPTRVDVRRFWDMRTISEERLRSIYHSQGYHGQDLEDYVLWTKVYVAFPDLLARFKNGWITEDDVRNQLTGLGMPAERVEEMIQTKIKPEKPAQVEAERQATATEIMKGVKKGIITWAEGVEMLGDLGYDEDTANFKLEVYLGVTSGSPESYSEFKRMTQLYRTAQGLPAKIPTEDLIQAEKDVLQAKADVDREKGEGAKESQLAPWLKALSDAEYRYRQLLIQWKEKK